MSNLVWEDPSPYLRGHIYEGVPGVPYPRLLPADAQRLPTDTWYCATIPVGVRLEICGDADGVVIRYHTATDDLGYRGDGAGRNFSLFHGDHLVGDYPATLGDAEVTIPLASLPPHSDRHVIAIPEGMRPQILSVAPLSGSIKPPSAQPRWLSYGDSISEGWVASAPGNAWTAIIGRRLGLDLINLGFAGAARAEIIVAEEMAKQEAAVITLAVGTNCYERIVHSRAQMAANLEAFLSVLRHGHPNVPILVISPLLRPDAEERKNVLGASLSDLRETIEQTVRERSNRDANLHLLEGRDLTSAQRLPDHIHPDDAGHREMATKIAQVMAPLVGSTSSSGGYNPSAAIG